MVTISKYNLIYIKTPSSMFHNNIPMVANKSQLHIMSRN